jgi:hypothetical protein
MRGQIFDGRPLGAALYNVPHDPLRYAISPGLACAANTPKLATFAHASGRQPGIDGVLDPIRDGHRSNMSALANQIDNGPVILAPLKVGNLQFCRLLAAQPATQEDPEQRSIPFALERILVRRLPERFGLFSSEPVTKANAEILRPFDSPDASSKIRAEETGISRFVRKPADGREPAVTGARRKLA